MQRIPVTRGFDKTEPIGYLTLNDGVEILPGEELAVAYSVLAGTHDNPTKILVHEITIVPSTPFGPVTIKR